jgi:hypothetical protein
MKIAGSLTIKDWEKLAKGLKNEKDENWNLAFNFFEERIKTRYLNPIKAILDMDLKTGEGFAVVNLQCSLIETIECFINGWKFSSNPYGWFKNEIEPLNKQRLNNKYIFQIFFEKREPFNNLHVDGSDFFESVRCALLHETQTKNGWKILTKKEGKSIENKTIYRNDFQNDIENLIQKYKKAILKGEDFDEIEGNELRENFISKFNNICEIS